MTRKGKAMQMVMEFQPLRRDDFPLLERWLREPHVRRWWGEPLSAEAIERKYVPRVDGADPTRAFVVRVDGRPAGYIQTYRIEDYPEYAAALELHEPAAGVDLFLGEPDLVGRGLGARVLRAFVDGVVFADPAVRCCVVGPDRTNRAAIRCYERAGFLFIREVRVPGEAEPEYLMTRRRGDPAAEGAG